jgi:uncharacterized membrane protein
MPPLLTVLQADKGLLRIGLQAARNPVMRHRGTISVLAAPALVGLWFAGGFALPYLTTDAGQFGIYWPRHQWLLAHIIGGIVALMSGPVQFWLGLNKRTRTPHRVLGVVYIVGVAVSGVAAFQLAAKTDFGWSFGLSLIFMSSAWMISTGLATVAICLKQVEQHREWMIRSYVLTFGFVALRIADVIFDIAKIGTIMERKATAGWLAWAVPLLITELILQGRKIFARPVSEAPTPDSRVYTAEPAPAAFALQNSGSSYQPQH